MPNLATDLARVMKLLEKATPGPWMTHGSTPSLVAAEVSGMDGKEQRVIVQATEPDGVSLHEMWANADLISTAVNFLRDHGPEIAETFKETPNG